MTCGVYKVYFDSTDKVYVGSSKNIEKRYTEHRSTLRQGNHHSVKLQNYYNKYDVDPRFMTLEVCSEGDRTMVEERWVKNLDSINNGFNVAEVLHIGLPTAESTITDSLPTSITVNTQLLHPPYNMTPLQCIIEAYLSEKIKICKELSIKYSESLPNIAGNLNITTRSLKDSVYKLKRRKLIRSANERNFYNKLSYYNDESPFVVNHDVTVSECCDALVN